MGGIGKIFAGWGPPSPPRKKPWCQIPPTYWTIKSCDFKFTKLTSISTIELDGAAAILEVAMATFSSSCCLAFLLSSFWLLYCLIAYWSCLRLESIIRRVWLLLASLNSNTVCSNSHIRITNLVMFGPNKLSKWARSHSGHHVMLWLNPSFLLSHKGAGYCTLVTLGVNARFR